MQNSETFDPTIHMFDQDASPCESLMVRLLIVRQFLSSSRFAATAASFFGLRAWIGGCLSPVALSKVYECWRDS